MSQTSSQTTDPNARPDRREFLLQAGGTLAAMALMPSVLPAAVRLAEPLNIGVIGAGRQGRALIAELQKIEGVSVKALCDTDASRLDRAVRQVRGATGYATHKDLFDKAKDVTAVIIATPTHQHKEIAVDAIGAGKHVYCETPLAHTIDDCRTIARAARGAKTVFATALEGRSNPVYTLARTFYRAGSLRELVSMRAQNYQQNSWRVAGGSDQARDRELNWKLDDNVSIGLPGELGTNQFDVFNWYTDQYPVRISGDGAVRVYDDGRKVPDTVLVTMKYSGGAMLSYAATLANSFEGRHEVFHGSRAAMKLAWSHGWMFKEAGSEQQGWEVYANRQQFHNDEGITLIADATKLAAQGKLKEGVGLPFPSHYYAISDFVKSVSEGKPAAASADEGFRATAIGILAHQAVMKGETISVDADMLKV
jgi:predicted dehydrogenase